MEVESLVAEVRPCEGAKQLAKVGPEVVLASEIVPTVNDWISKIPKEQLAQFPESYLQEQRKLATMQILKQRIDLKLIYMDAKRSIPEERLPQLEQQMGDIFESEELPKRIEVAGVTNRREFEEKLQQVGSSIGREKRAFVERVLAQQWLQQQKTDDEDVGHYELWEYYKTHQIDFQTKGRARWEEISVRLPRYSDGRQARIKLGYLGNQLGAGTSIEDVLRLQPEEGPECRGGRQDWITQGSGEVTDVVEEAIFGLPVGNLSQILEAGNNYHIVRVVQREDATCASFEAPETQAKIREEIKELRHQEEIESYLAKLRQECPVWTVFDDDPALAELHRQSDPLRK